MMEAHSYNLSALEERASQVGNLYLRLALSQYHGVIETYPAALEQCPVVHGERRRTCPELVNFILKASACLLAAGSAVEAEIAVAGIRLWAAHRDCCSGANCQACEHDYCCREVWRHVSIDDDPPENNIQFRTPNAAALYHFADRLLGFHQIAWPHDAYDAIAEPRNSIAHHTCQVTEGGDKIFLLEDRKALVLLRQVERSMECLAKCCVSFRRLETKREHLVAMPPCRELVERLEV